MRNILALFFITVFGFCYSQEKIGSKESNGLFYIEKESDFIECDLGDIFIDTNVWYAEIDIKNKSGQIVRRFTIVQAKADSAKAKKLNIDSLLGRKGELYFYMVNRDTTLLGFTKYKYFSGLNISEKYSMHNNGKYNGYNYFNSELKALENEDYDIYFTCKLSKSIKKGVIHSTKKRSDPNNPIIDKYNWYNFTTGTGMYNGNKLYTGRKGGIYYISGDSKVYVTQEVQSWKTIKK